MKNYKGIFKRGSVYWIRYTDPTGKVIRESARTTNINEALKLLSRRKTQVADGKFPERILIKNHYFHELADKYDEYVSIQKCYNRFKKYLIPALKQRFGRLLLRQFTSQTLEQFIVDLTKQGKTTATINRYIACLKHMLHKAVDWNMVEKEVLERIQKVKPLKGEVKRLRYLTSEEINKLLSVCDNSLYPIVFTALNTGMRREEILSLKWSNIDLKNGYIHIETSKNKERRDVPINASLLNLFKRMFTERRIDTDYVFVNPLTGTRLTDIKRSFHTALKRAGIKDFRFHDLRHTFASHLVMSGVDLTTVKELLGHKDIKMTLRYSHLAPEHKQKAVTVLDSIFSKQSQAIEK